MLKYNFIILVISLLLLSCGKSDHRTYDLVIKDISLFDGNEDLGIVNLGISNDTIATISPEKIYGDSIIEGSGKYLIPGLVNSHIHTWRLEDLRESYRAGVLTLVNLHQVDESLDSIFRLYRDTTGYANYYSSGIAATVPKGHPTQFGSIETINDTMSPKQFILNRLNNDADLIKIVRENTAYPPDFTPTPTLDYAQIQALIDESKLNKKKVVVHAVYLDDFLEISRFKPDGFVHMWFFKDTLTSDKINDIKKSGAFIIPTALTQDRLYEELANDSIDARKEWGYHHFTSMESLKAEIARLHNEGIPVLAGTDPPNFGINYGDDLIKELLIYRDAGLSNIEVLQTATGNAGAYLDIGGNGQINVGAPATFVILNENPVKDLEALKNIHSIWKNGKTK